MPPNPLPSTPPPVVLFIHGSVGAQYQPKNWGIFQSWGRLIAAARMVAVSFTHRLGYPNPLFGEAAADHRAALAFVRANAGSWGADADRLAMMAWSGGGPLLSAGLREKPPFLRCLLAFYALLDARSYPPFADHESREALESFSPVLCLQNGGSAIPPVFIARAGQDELPPVNDSIDRFFSRALAVNAAVALMNHPRGEHGFDNQNDDSRTREIIRAAIAFLEAHLLEH